MKLIIRLLLVGILVGVRIWAAPQLDAALPPPWPVIAKVSCGFLIALAAAILLDDIVRRALWHGYFRARKSQEAPALLRDLATVLIFAFAISIWLYFDLDFSAAGIFAASGATAVIIGLALQAMILDLFSGLSVNLDRSYVIGDWLTVHSQELREPVYGRVEGIGWRCTLLRLDDGRCMLMPNRFVTANPVTNHSFPHTPKRLSVEITLDARVPPERATRLLLGETFKAVQAAGMTLDPPPSVLLLKAEDDTSRYRVQFYADPHRISPEEACSIVLTAVHSAVIRAGLPNPVRQVELSEPAPALGDDLVAREALGCIALFADALSGEQLDLLAARAMPVTFAPGQVLMVQGADESTMFVILDGAARVSVSTESAAADRPVAILAAGDVVGEMSLMTGAPRSATVTALTALRALTISKETIEALFEHAPELLERFGKILAEREAALKSQMNQAVSWEVVQQDLIARMRTFFARAFGGADKRAS